MIALILIELIVCSFVLGMTSYMLHSIVEVCWAPCPDATSHVRPSSEPLVEGSLLWS